MTGSPASHPAHVEDLAEPASGAEHELDLALVEAQQSGTARGSGISGGAGSPAASWGSIGPAGEGGASPISGFGACCSAGGTVAVGGGTITATDVT